MKKLWPGYGFLLILVIGIFLESCKPTPYRYDHGQPSEAGDPVDARPEILFMIFSIQQNDSGTTIELKNKKIKYGALKGEPESSDAADRIYVAQLSREKTEISGFYIEHPLLKNVEYTNERNELATKFVKLSEAEFFIRTKLAQEGAYIRLDEIQEERVVNSFIFNVKK